MFCHIFLLRRFVFLAYGFFKFHFEIRILKIRKDIAIIVAREYLNKNYGSNATVSKSKAA